MAVPAWAQALTETLFQAASNPAGRQNLAPRRIAEQLGQWFGHLSRNAALHWTPTLAGGHLCSFCDESAMGTCTVCQDPCCLAHAHVSHRAELVCDECIDRLLGRQAKRGPEKQAFDFFNLTSQARWEDVQAVYKARIRLAHPDVGGSDAETVKVNRFYVVLKEHYQRKAA